MVVIQQYPLWTKCSLLWNPILNASTYGRCAFEQSQIFISHIAFYIFVNKSIFVLYKLKLDGRPMSGDIGRGATKESIAFAVELAKAKERPPG